MTASVSAFCRRGIPDLLDQKNSPIKLVVM